MYYQMGNCAPWRNAAWVLPSGRATVLSRRRSHGPAIQLTTRRLAVPERQEIDDLLRRDDGGLVTGMLELLDAPAGPLAVRNPSSMTGSPVGGEQQTTRRSAMGHALPTPYDRCADGPALSGFFCRRTWHASRTWSDLVMVEDSGCLDCPDRNGCWRSRAPADAAPSSRWLTRFSSVMTRGPHA